MLTGGTVVRHDKKKIVGEEAVAHYVYSSRIYSGSFQFSGFILLSPVLAFGLYRARRPTFNWSSSLSTFGEGWLLTLSRCYATGKYRVQY